MFYAQTRKSEEHENISVYIPSAFKTVWSPIYIEAWPTRQAVNNVTCANDDFEHSRDEDDIGCNLFDEMTCP